MNTPFPKRIALMALAVASSTALSAAVYTYDGPSYSIPDGNPIGVSSQVTVSGERNQLIDINVLLNVSGGYNGHLYAYLSYNGSLVPLLNRIGVSGANPFGSDGSGLNVTFTDTAAQNIHAAGAGFLTGVYRPDGQALSPLSAPGEFHPAGGAIALTGTFGDLNPNGVWTLYIADVVAGGGVTVVDDWSLGITTVPEPSAVALLVLALFATYRPLRTRKVC